MVYYIVLILIIVVMGFWVWYLIKNKNISKSSDGNYKKIENYNKQREEEIIERKAKILELFNDKERLKNDDIQKLLRVSDATITRYMDELEKEGKVRQTGKGSSAYYEKV